MDKKNILKTLACLISIVFLLNSLADALLWYNIFPWFDMLMHFLGGISVGFLFFYIFQISNSRYSFSGMLKAILFVLLIGLGWELFEVIVNNVFARDAFDLSDTLSDLFFDLCGGFCAILYIWKQQEKKEQK